MVSAVFAQSIFGSQDAEAYSVEAWPYVDLSCSDRGSYYSCSVDITAELAANNYGWCQAVSLYVRLSSEFRSTRDYYMGYRDCWADYLIDYTPHYDAFQFNVSKDYIKEHGYTYTRGNYRYWEYDVEIFEYDYWDTDVPREDAWGWPSASVELTEEERISSDFTIKAIDENGYSLSSVMPDVRVEVDPDERAYACARESTGYTKIKWGWNTYSGWWNSAELCYDAGYITEDTVIYAIYQRDEFAARARVFEGSTTSGTNYYNTDYVQVDREETIYIECPNDGCLATYDLSIQRKKGNGPVRFEAKYNSPGSKNLINTANTYPTSPLYPSQEFTTISTYFNGYYHDAVTVQLKPGQEVCFRLEFTPYGSYSNDTKKTVGACAKAKPSTFEGRVTLNGSVNGDTGWTGDSSTITKSLSSCTYNSPCSVEFKHYLRRTSGIASTKYTIYRTSNYSTVSGGTIKNNVEETFEG